MIALKSRVVFEIYKDTQLIFTLPMDKYALGKLKALLNATEGI
jgi:hypothetical protein